MDAHRLICQYADRPRVGRIYQLALCYHWSSAASYTRKVADGVTDENPHLGAFSDADREVYAEALMSGVDEVLIRRMEGERAIGTRAFANTLKMERGRYRVKRGRPAQSVRIRL